MKHKILAASVLAAFLSTGVQAADLVNGLGGTAGFGENTVHRNDDGSTAAIDVTSVFSGGLNFFGTTYNSVYLNNNGNITFNNARSVYTPSDITGTTNNPMIAGYFADVDTRNAQVPSFNAAGNSTGSNSVFWDLDAAAGTFTATWDDVGYFSQQNGLLNSFQIILSNNGALGNGNFGIEYRYEDINWTTGGASGGTNGLGGTVARAGYTSGNGTDFHEFAESGIEAQMLALVDHSNVNEAGVFRFGVVNGSVVAVPTTPTPPPVSAVPIPAALFLFAPALLGFLGLRRKSRA